MSSFVEIIQQLRTDKKSFDANLSKLESLGGSSNKALLRELIQDARQLHEGSVVLSYILFDSQNKESEQLDIELQNQEPLEKSSSKLSHDNYGVLQYSDDEEIEEALNEALDFTQQVNIKTEEVLSEIRDDIPTQEEVVGQLEDEISSLITATTSSVYEHQEEEDNSLAAKLARKKIDNLNNAIGINEKFLFTNELFDGNTEQFLKTIDELNNCVSLTEATEKLIAVAQKRSWILEEEPYQKLQSLLSRKYQ